MCLFPRPVQPNTLPYRKGIYEFACGVCPECLAKRSRLWALRASMEAKVSPAYMITLTYDNYKRDKRGYVVGELPPDRSLHVNKRDCQLFFKRLRRKFPDRKIKYICTAEYGTHTHRAHYHVLLFGLVLDDLIYKGRSKRGNIIYRSPMLSRVWANAPADADWRTLPIVSVDACMVGPAVARYCTKYCSKDSGRDGGEDDTFMLFSRGIGDSELRRLFNGKSYILDGREYPIPKQIWQKEISDCYDVSFRYVSPDRDPEIRIRQRNVLSGRFIPSRVDRFWRREREYALFCRDSHPAYQDYLAYWKKKADEFELTRPSSFDRIRALPDDKYRAYKAAALDYINGVGGVIYPRASERVRAHALEKANRERFAQFGMRYFPEGVPKPLPFVACHKTANDTEIVRGMQVFPQWSTDESECLFDLSYE